MCYEEVQAIVAQVAELLPEPPCRGNAGAYGQWEDLTIDTARRLARLLDADTGLIRSLIAGEQRATAAGRDRRVLLLRVTLLTALQLRKAEPAPPSFRGGRAPRGAIRLVAAETKTTHRFAGHLGRLDAA
jgi:hypothetical protein